MKSKSPSADPSSQFFSPEATAVDSLYAFLQALQCIYKHI